MFYDANLYKVGLMNSQRHGGLRSTPVTFSTPVIPGGWWRRSTMEIRYNETNLHISIPEMKFCQVHSSKHPDEAMCVPWVQNGDTQYMMSKYLSYIH